MFLHVVHDFHQHPTACSPSVLITSCLPLFYPLINSTPTTTTLGVVTWKLGIVLRPSGASFPAHLRPPTVSTPAREGEEDKLEAYQVKADKAAGIMWLMVEQAQRVHFRGIKDDAVSLVLRSPCQGNEKGVIIPEHNGRGYQ